MTRGWRTTDDAVPRRAWAGLAVVAAASFVATLDAMVLYVAFGSIRRDFPEVSAATLSWILSGYTIVIAAGMIGAGRWADRLGRRRVFLAGMGVFTVASAICAVAPGAGVLVAARVLQGSGAAALFLLSRVDSAPAYLAVWLPFTLVSGVGVSMVLPLLTSAAVAGLPSDRFATGSAVNAALCNLGQTLGAAIFVAVAGRTTAGELVAHHRLAWWLVAAAGAAVTATSWRLPRVGSAPRAVERDRHLTVLRPTRSRSSPIVAAEPATTRISRVLQGVPS